MISRIKLIIVLGFVTRIGISIWNGFFGPSFGAESDALGFHREAVALSHKSAFDAFRIGWIYSDALGLFYYLTTDSLFLGSLLSCIAWLVSALILGNTLRILLIKRRVRAKIMLIYALLPSSILMTGVTLREPYQLLFVSLAMYGSLRIYLHKSAVHWLWLIIGCLGMGMLHGALFAFGLFILIGTMVLIALRGGKSISLVKFIFATPLVALVLFYGLSLFTNVSYNLDDGLGASVGAYQQNLLDINARATYRVSVEINSLTNLLFFIPSAIFQYMFEPMPWHISSVADVELLLENSLRAWLIWRAWSGLSNMPEHGRRPVLFVFLSYLVIETIWSLGTANWGTAVRHHLPSMGLLLVAAFAYSANKTGSQVKSRLNKLNPAQ